MNEEEILRQYLREEIKRILNEMSTTGNVAGYLTPAAFRGNSEKNVARLKKIATQFGYELTPIGKKQMSAPADKMEIVKNKLNPLEENRYYAYRNDTSKQPHQKLGNAISEINRQLTEIQKLIKMNARLKNEYKIDSSKMWKRTLTGLVKLEAKLIGLAQQIREIRN
jgi:hypothetical protein